VFLGYVAESIGCIHWEVISFDHVEAMCDEIALELVFDVLLMGIRSHVGGLHFSVGDESLTGFLWVRLPVYIVPCVSYQLHPIGLSAD